jgi:NHL repeat
MMLRSFLVLSVLLALSCAGTGVANSDGVSTLAGSGATGYDDGPAQSASFMLPLGVAYDAEGNLYVADAAAQRIREITRAGVVRTLAGGGVPDASGVWVPGGYADGDGAHARFNHPSAVAVGPDGRIYVADAYNHCIRVVTPDGFVSTLAGSPERPGLRTGPRSVAEFVLPAGLAFDRAKRLYVVDTALAGALRTIDPDGAVGELKLPGRVQPAGGLAVSDGPTGRTIVLADVAGLYVLRPDNTVSLIRSEFFRAKCAAHTAPAFVACDEPETLLREHRDVGMPMGIAAFNDHQIAYADYKTNSVRYVDLRTSTLRLLAGYPLMDGAGRGGGHRDGSGSVATFNMPFGVATAPNGDLAIADGGSRRVRVLRGIDRTEPVFIPDPSRGAADSHAAVRAVAYAGDVTAWQGTEWGDSIAGRLQQRLRSATCRACAESVVPVVWETLRSGIAALSSPAAARFDVVVLQLNMNDVAAFARLDPLVAARNPAAWRGPLAAALQRLDAATKARRARLIVLLQPLPEDVGPATALWRRLDGPLGPSSGGGALRAAVAASGTEVADATGAFATANNGAVPAALFATDGAEFAAGGREVLAVTAAGAVRREAAR